MQNEMDRSKGGFEPSADELIEVLKNLENLAASNPPLYKAIVEQIKSKLIQSPQSPYLKVYDHYIEPVVFGTVAISYAKLMPALEAG